MPQLASQQTKEYRTPETTALLVFKTLESIGNPMGRSDCQNIPLYQRIVEMVQKSKKLTFILPAFPAKSANREKTFSPLPDLGEVLALERLQKTCEKIGRIYEPGAEVVICSDGRVFNDLVLVSDENLLSYKMAIRSIIEKKGLHHLKTFSLDDCYDHQDFQKMRKDLEENYAESLDSLRQRVKNEPLTKSLFNGIHRFMKEDMANLSPDLSKNQLMKKSKEVAYKVVQRSGAWDGLLAEKFQDTLRLSIHPYPPSHQKFGVQLVSSGDIWATPWHNVTLKEGSRFRLVKRRQALQLGATLRYAEGRYAYYEAS